MSAAPTAPVVGDRDVWRIAAPMILSNVSVPLLGLVDTAVVGHLDSPWYLGAVAIGAAVFSFIYNGVNFLRMGTTGVAAQAFGAEDPETLRRSLREALSVAVAIGIAFIALQHPISSIALAVTSPEANTAIEAGRYIDIRIWSAPATLVSYVVIGWFLGLQNARVPLTIVLVINLTNIALDLLFVVGLGMTSAGVALASVIAEYGGSAVALTMVSRELGRWPAGGRAPKSGLADYLRYFRINGNIFLRTLALMFTFFFITAQGARFGTVILAANAVLMNLQFLLAYLLDGLAHAAEALAGKATGRRDRALFEASVRRVLVWSVSIAAAMSLAFALFGPAVIRLLTSLPGVIAAADEHLIWLIVSPLVSVWSFAYDGVFIGATRVREMRNVMVLSTLAIFLPVWWLSRDLGNHGLWLAFMLFMAARAVGMHYYYRRIPASIERAG